MLLTTPPDWSAGVDNHPSTPSTGAMGTLVTPGVSDAYGSSVSLLSALAFDASMLVISTTIYSSATDDAACLADILIDPAGGTAWSTASLITELMVSRSWTPSTVMGPSFTYFLPVFVPKGASIGAKAKTILASSPPAGRIQIAAYGAPSHPMNWSGQSVTTVGIASGKGLVHTPGASGTFSSWTDLGTALASPGKAIQFAVQGDLATQTATMTYSLEFGVGGMRIGPKIIHQTNTNEAGWTITTGPIWTAIPSGAQLQVRAASSIATTQALNVAAYVVN